MTGQINEDNKAGFFKSDQFAFLSLIVLAAFWAVVLYLYCSAKLASLRYTIIDTGVVESVLWNTLQGNILQSSISRGSFFNFHFSPSLILLVPLYAIGQSTEWLFLLQSLAIAVGAPLIYLLAKSCGLSRLQGFLLGAVWLFSAPTIGLATFDFHEVSITGWLFILTALFAIKDKLLPVLILTAILLGIKEDMAIYVASLGLVLILGYRRSRIGWLLIGISLIYFIIVYFYLWSALYPNRVRLEADRFAQFGARGDILEALFANPLLLLEPLLRWNRLWAVVMLLLPLSLLPLWHRAFLGVLPGLWVFLSLSVFGWGIFNMHYHAPIVALLFIAAIPAMIWLRGKLPVLFKISIAALIPLTLGMHFAIPPEFAWGIYNPASLKPHPSLNTVREVFAAPATQSIAADVFNGSAEVRRKQLFIYPCAYLPDIICSSSAFSMPLTLVLIKSLGYGLERPDPVFLILSRASGCDAGEYYMERLRWIEAEESDAISWDMRPLSGATGGRALYLADNYGWGDRYLALREEILPAGSYRMGVRLARGGKEAADGSITLSVVAHGDRGGSRNVATRDILSGEMERDALKTYWVEFTLQSGAFVHPLLHFHDAGEYWIDGAELKGLDQNFDVYFNTFCKAILRADEADWGIEAGTNAGIALSEGELQMDRRSAGELALTWQTPASLQPGMYLLCTHICIESGECAQIPWADLYTVQGGDRTKLMTLYYDNLQVGRPGDQLQMNHVRIPKCDSIEMHITKPQDSKLSFDQLLFLNLR